MTFRVAFSPKARSELTAIGRWWSTNRRESPRLFRHEVKEALDRLRENPEVGEAIDEVSSGVRRLLPLRTRYYLYYQVAHARRTVLVLSVWHMARGSEPPL